MSFTYHCTCQGALMKSYLIEKKNSYDDLARCVVPVVLESVVKSAYLVNIIFCLLTME